MTTNICHCIWIIEFDNWQWTWAKWLRTVGQRRTIEKKTKKIDFDAPNWRCGIKEAKSWAHTHVPRFTQMKCTQIAILAAKQLIVEGKTNESVIQHVVAATVWHNHTLTLRYVPRITPSENGWHVFKIHSQRHRRRRDGRAIFAMSKFMAACISSSSEASVNRIHASHYYLPSSSSFSLS